MKTSSLLRFFVSLFLCSSLRATTSADNLWRETSAVPPVSNQSLRHDIQPATYRTFTLDAPQLRARLLRAAPQFTRTPGVERTLIISLPKPDGSFARFRVEEVQLMEPELAAQFPEIKTYRGTDLADPLAQLQLDINGRTMHAQVLAPSGTYYVDPYFQHDGSLYMSYLKSELSPGSRQFQCLVREEKPNARLLEAIAHTTDATTGKTLRTYRIAYGTSLRYSQYHGGTVPVLADVLAAVVTMTNRISGVYETELGIRFVLVANETAVIATATNPTPYTDTPGDIQSNPAFLDQKIGASNYDIGHCVTVGSGGVAYLGVVCTGFDASAGGSAKAGGTTGIDPPVGDGFWIDYVAHEMGHQFGGNHTFNGDGTNCGDVNQNPDTAYEPGSGSTIQAYAGICGTANDLQPHSDPYWHFVSLIEMFAYSTVGDGGTCPAQVAMTNNPPTVNAGADYKIPARTPFVLTAVNGNDPDGDAITYCWEEADLGPQKAGTAPDNGQSALFRSFLPTTNPARTFPRLSDLLANQTQTIGEKLPTTTRSLNFRVTVRDNKFGGYGMDDMHIDVLDSGAGFAVTSPNTAVSFAGGTNQTITWNVANSASAPISTTQVNIRLSTDGGLTYQYLLAGATPNDGSELITLPYLNSATCRIKVEAVGNIFFDISNANFSIVSVDSDGDGIPDGYETANGLNPNDPADAARDADGDGQSNYAEFIAGTNLNSAGSVLRVTAISRAPSFAAVTFTTVPNKRYQIEASANLASWTPISEDIFPTGASFTYNDAGGGSAIAIPLDHRFYRARVYP